MTTSVVERPVADDDLDMSILMHLDLTIGVPTAADPSCPGCGHPKSMHLSYGGCSYTEANGQNCRCTVKRSDI